jgi:hypothetical protein
MSQQIPVNFVNQFRANFDMLVQQMDSRLLNAVEQEQLNGEFGFREQLGAVLPQVRVSRHADTPFTQIPHSRRRFNTVEWELGEIIDKQDTERMLISPQSSYVTSFAAAFARQRDKIILDSFFADAATGKAGGTTVAFPAGQQIAVDFVETGSATNSSLTLGKLRRAVELLGDVGAEDAEMYIAVTRREVSAMLRTLEYNSADYVESRPLQNAGFGQPLPKFMGLNWIVLPNRVMAPDGTTTLLTMFNLDGSSHRRIPVWSKKGMLFCQTAQTEINAAPDPTKGFNTRLHGRASFGATRLEEIRVVEIKCSTSVF